MPMGLGPPLLPPMGGRIGGSQPPSMYGDGSSQGPYFGDGGGSFAVPYAGGRMNDASTPFPGGRSPPFPEQPSPAGTMTGFGESEMMEAYALFQQFAESRYGKRAGDVPVQHMLQEAYATNRGDPKWERAIQILATEMGGVGTGGLPQPWDNGAR